MSKELQYADLEYPEKIEKLYHISDIHIRLQKRHDEYKKVFASLYQQLKEEVISKIKTFEHAQRMKSFVD